MRPDRCPNPNAARCQDLSVATLALSVATLALFLPPFAEELLTPPRRVFLKELDAPDSIRPKMPYGAAELAPRGEDARRLKIGERDRPHDALGLGPALIAIREA